MFRRLSLPIGVFLFLHIIPSLQVDIKLNWYHSPMRVITERDPISATCTGIPPGDCCKPHSELILPPPETLYDYGTSETSFTGLLAQQLGAGWSATSPRYEGIGCNRTPFVRVFGPTDGEVSLSHPDGRLPAPNTMVFSASWIDLRTRFPPDSAATRYLQWQGVKSMVWGSNTWSADGIPFPKRDQERKLNGWAEKGQVVIETPRRWRYPDVYNVNGTEYRDAGDGVFRSGDGKVLNLTGGKV